MPDLWAMEFESPSGDSESATQAFSALNWRTATVTLRRRAPHTLAIVVRRASEGGHFLADFVAGRELRILRNGAYWLTGFMDAPSLGDYSTTRHAFGSIQLPGWGNAYALMFGRNNHRTDGGGAFYGGFDVDGLISALLDNAGHGAGADWFPAAGRTIYASAVSLPLTLLFGKSALEHINDLCDIDATAWRAGVNSSTGAFTFKVGTTVEIDYSASLKLTGGINCAITGFSQDGTQITSRVRVISKRPAVDTRVTTATIALATTIVLDDVAGFADGDVLRFGVGTATEENRTIASISGATVTLTSGLTNAHAANEVVKANSPNQYRQTIVNAAASVAQTYHERDVILIRDDLTDTTRRTAAGNRFIETYNHPLATASVVVTDALMIDVLLDAGLEPGDRVSLTSIDQDLGSVYNDTTVQVQEMAIVLEPNRATSITLTVGDPRIDELAAFERQLAALKSTLQPDSV